MIDPIFFSEKQQALFIQGLKKKNYDLGLVTKVQELNERRKRTITETEGLKAQKNKVSTEIGIKKSKGESADSLLAQMKDLSEGLKQREEETKRVDEEFKNLALLIPNIPHESVPEGVDASNNLIVRTVGQPGAFSFEPKDHMDVAEKLGIVDTDRATRMTGTRFSVLRGIGARLERALIQFMLDVQTQENGYTELWVPLMVNRDALVGTGNLPKFEEDLFKVQPYDYYLIPTAEVPITNLHRTEILNGADLPLKYTAYTPCFRSEVGSYGRDTRGLVRQHQFDKIEIVKISRPETSYEEHEKLVADAESILKKLELPYRVALLCGGDMSFPSAKTYDLEVWLPSQKTYREISSCSNFEDFQARRAQIRFKDGQGDKPRLVHTLNGSGLAVGRTWLAILENYQQEDGSVVVPKALRPYLGLDVIRPQG